MMAEAISNTGAVPREVSADAGYYSAQAVGDLGALGVDPFVAPEQTPTAERFRRRPEVAYPVTCPPGTGCGGSCRPNGAASATHCTWKPSSRYSARSSRARGFRHFLLRGLEKVNGEWSLICTGHNLLKLARFGRLLADHRCCIPTWRARHLHRQRPDQQVA